jgi:hypothetical protein
MSGRTTKTLTTAEAGRELGVGDHVVGRLARQGHLELRLLPPGAVDAAPPADPDAHLTLDRRAVRAAIRQAGHALTIPEIAQAVGRDHDPVAQLLHRMAGEGLLVKEGRGQYALPAGPSTPAPV